MFRTLQLQRLVNQSASTVLRKNLSDASSQAKPISYNLENKVAIVTASTDGIGFSIAQRLAQSGASVVISSRKQENVDKAVRELDRIVPGKVAGTVCQVIDSEHRKNLLDFTVEKFGGVDILVSNAGIQPAKPGLFFDYDENAWDEVMNVNIKSAFFLTKEALPHLKQRKDASIVYISSITAYQQLSTFKTIGLYSISKTALLGLCKVVSQQCAPMGIRANSVSPGIIQTKLVSSGNEEVFKNYLRDVPMGRIGNVEEVSGLVAFLCSKDASYITGESLVPSGGFFTRL